MSDPSEVPAGCNSSVGKSVGHTNKRSRSGLLLEATLFCWENILKMYVNLVLTNCFSLLKSSCCFAEPKDAFYAVAGDAVFDISTGVVFKFASEIVDKLDSYDVTTGDLICFSATIHTRYFSCEDHAFSTFDFFCLQVYSPQNQAVCTVSCWQKEADLAKTLISRYT